MTGNDRGAPEPTAKSASSAAGHVCLWKSVFSTALVSLDNATGQKISYIWTATQKLSSS